MRDRCDLLLKGARIIDGSGGPAFPADVAIVGDRIAAIGEGLDFHAGAERDLSGLVLAPGFIDVHTHDDRAVLADPWLACKRSQGVTTVVTGNCGISLSPLAFHGEPPAPLTLLGEGADFRFPTFEAYAGAVDRAQPAVNVAALVGHSTLRVGRVADLGRGASDQETAAMAEDLDRAMAAGAVGFSSGLFYGPSRAADVHEVAALARVAAARGGLYASHIRDEYDRVIEALDECFEAARRAGATCVVSHHKCAGPKNWGRSAETLAHIQAARRGQPIVQDAYPYTAGSTVLDPDLVDGVIRILITWSKARPDLAGRDLADLAAEWGVDQKEAARRLQPAGACYFQMREDDVRRVLADPHTMIGSDGLPHDAHPHPRLWGAFPRVLGHYSRDLGFFGLEEAVRRMTGLAADTFGLKDRGRVRAGAIADLVAFDPARIADRATFEQPCQAAAGIDLVLVNGVPALDRSGQWAERRAGRMLGRG